jgi:DNA repair exonuclease SbcCD ATPase subunit
MLDYVTPVLNDRAEYYSNLLSGGEMKVYFTTKTTLKSGDEKDKFQIMVEQRHGSDLYMGNSKGEKARADLIIAMALGDLATFRTSKQLPWRFLDEPFESIDDAGNEAVMSLLNDQKSRYKTVFVVTHKPAFKKLFNQRITVVKENSISTIEHDNT